MKKLLSALLCSALLLSLAACVTKPDSRPYTADLATQLTENTDTFSEPLEPLDADLIWILYELDASGAPVEDLTDAAGYCSSGATCEQVVVLCFASRSSADLARTHLDSWLEQQITSNRSYRPKEVPKLEKAILSQRDNTLLLLVANDYDAAATLINQ